MRYVSIIIGAFFFVLGLVAAVTDLTSPSGEPWHRAGVLWFEWSPSSLQVSEAVISRYIDPCGLFVSLGCAPFLWHPIISTILTWYAIPVFFGFSLIFFFLGRHRGKARRIFRNRDK
jgi:hypothetical protein